MAGQEPFDVQGLVQGMAKFNPVTAIPGLVQQGQQAIDPVIQMIMQMLQGQPAQADGGNPISGVGAPGAMQGGMQGQPMPLRDRMTR